MENRVNKEQEEQRRREQGQRNRIQNEQKGERCHNESTRMNDTKCTEEPTMRREMNREHHRTTDKNC